MIAALFALLLLCVSPAFAGDTLTFPVKLVSGGAVFANLTNTSQNGIQMQGEGNSKTTSFHLNPGGGTLPTDTIVEFVLHRTNLQAFGGDYGRWSFTALGPASGNVSAIGGEFGGKVIPTPFIFQSAYENPPGVFAIVEGLRFQTITLGEAAPSGSVAFGVGATVPRNQIVLSVGNIGAPGVRDSHAVLWESKANDGVERAVWWRQKINTLTNSGGSQFILQSNLNGAGWVTQLSLNSDGTVVLPNLRSVSSCTGQPSKSLVAMIGTGAIVQCP